MLTANADSVSLDIAQGSFDTSRPPRPWILSVASPSNHYDACVNDLALHIGYRSCLWFIQFDVVITTVTDDSTLPLRASTSL